MKSKLKVATRDSELAIAQVREVEEMLVSSQFVLCSLKSFGDKHKNISLMSSIPDDFFSREIDAEVKRGNVDIAIHSAKDLPLKLSEELMVIAITVAFDKTDSLVSKAGLTLRELPQNAKVGTSSFSRKVQLRKERPDIEIVSIRGTIQERIATIENGEVDAVIVATCALKRLGIEKQADEVLPFSTHPMQGNLAIVARKDRPDLQELFACIDVRKKYGKVWLVGAGPGAADLRTVRAESILKIADVILYDALVDETMLDSYDAQKIFVGKRKNNHHVIQEETNEKLFVLASQGKNVVRLKGGDPHIFGRGGEEQEYLRSRYVSVESVPGITTALAASNLFGIPLTKRGVSSSVAFCSAHPINRFKPPIVDTLVIYMGMSCVLEVSNILKKCGYSSDSSVAIIYNVSLPTQRIEINKIESMSLYSNHEGAPGIIVVGDTVKEYIRQVTVLVTGTETNAFVSEGKIIHLPLINISALDSYVEADSEVSSLDSYDCILFTSKYSVKYYFWRFNNLGFDSRKLKNKVIVAMGERSAEELLQYGIKADYIPCHSSSVGIVDLFKVENIKVKDILIPRSNKGSSHIQEALSKEGYSIKNVAMYKNESADKATVLVDLKEIDAIAFASPSGVESFVDLYGSLPTDKFYLSVGPVTSKAIKKEYCNARIKTV